MQESVFEDAKDGVEGVRQKIGENTRFVRQYRVIRSLREAGFDSWQIATLTRADVDPDFSSNQAAVSV